MQLIITYFLQSCFFLALIITFFSFLASYKVYPVLIYLCHVKRLFKLPEERGSHILKTPTMGGVAIYFGFTVAFTFIGSILYKHLRLDIMLDLMTSLLVLFFIGIKDDLLTISPLKKMISQLVAAGIIILFSETYITSFYGVFGIYKLPYMISLIVTFFVFILVINAYNFIDGIDGLAGGIALMICFFFGIFFLVNRQVTQMLISFSLIGPLIGFLKFNISKTRKIFMGDTGTMIIGFIIVYQSVSFLTVNQTAGIPFSLKNGPIFVLALLSLPLTDILRIFIIRINNGKSPFRPDRNHIHHHFLDSGFTHIKATITIVSLCLLVVLSAFLLQDLNINLSFFLIVIISFLAYLPLTFKKMNVNVKKEINIKKK